MGLLWLSGNVREIIIYFVLCVHFDNKPWTVSKTSTWNVNSHGSRSVSHHESKQKLDMPTMPGESYSSAPNSTHAHMPMARREWAQNSVQTHTYTNSFTVVQEKHGSYSDSLLLNYHSASIGFNKRWYGIILKSWLPQYFSSICILWNTSRVSSLVSSIVRLTLLLLKLGARCSLWYVTLNAHKSQLADLVSCLLVLT